MTNDQSCIIGRLVKISGRGPARVVSHGRNRKRRPKISSHVTSCEQIT
jgi:hypothetical protein